MRGTLGFDPRQCDYGPATEAIQQILLDWEDIDWFAPGHDDRDLAARLFLEHNRLGRAFARELFASHVEVEFRSSGWSEFIAWCTRARTRSAVWDWKFSALKPLSRAHAEARGWCLDEQPAREAAGSRPGDLFVRIRGAEHTSVFWCGVMPKIPALEAYRGEPAGNAGEFYLSYAHDDVIRCLQWQLAEGVNHVDGNPFVPLLACYRTGYYPFVMNRESVLLFRFSTAMLPGRRETPPTPG